MFDSSYVYFTCKKCGALFSASHFFSEMTDYTCDACEEKEEA